MQTLQAVQLADQHYHKSFSQWTLYFIVGFSPVILGIVTLANIAATEPKSSERIEHALKEEPAGDLITAAIPVFFVCIFIEVMASLASGKKVYRFNDSMSSLYAGALQLLSGIITKPFSVFPYAYIYSTYGKHLFPREWIDAHFWVCWVVMFIGIDHMYYWFHRFSHEWNTMWAAHIVHHSSEEYNLTTALRQSALQPFFSWMFYLPLAFIFPVKFYLIHYQMNTLYQFWIHTKMIHKMPKPFEYIFNTPSHHRVHHGRNPLYIDKNYGGSLILFDRIYGTFQEEVEPVLYGVTYSLGTWNPIYTQLHHWEDIWQTIKLVPSFFGKLRVVLDRGPGYNYEVRYRNKNPPPPEVQDRPVYDSTLPNYWMTAYVVFASVEIFVEALTYDAYADEMDTFKKFLFFSFLLFSIFSLMNLFDRNKWCIRLEVLKHVLGMVLGFELVIGEFDWYQLWMKNVLYSVQFNVWVTKCLVMSFWVIIFGSTQRIVESVPMYATLDAKKDVPLVVEGSSLVNPVKSSGGLANMSVTPKGHVYTIIEAKKDK